MQSSILHSYGSEPEICPASYENPGAPLTRRPLAAAGAAAAPQAVRRRGEERPPLQCVVAVAPRRRMGEEGGFAARSAPQQPHSTRRLQTNAFSSACLFGLFRCPPRGGAAAARRPGGGVQRIEWDKRLRRACGQGGRGGVCAGMPAHPPCWAPATGWRAGSVLAPLREPGNVFRVEPA